jgi:small subunit ribosomal protein S9
LVQETTQEHYYYGTGKRKTAIAKVRLYLRTGSAEAGPASQIQVNGRLLEEIFPWQPWQATIQEPLRVTESLGRFSIIARVDGGGVSARSEAIRHGISRALALYDESLKTPLRKHGFLTRDARIKESKKYGLKRARRAPQYTKR